MVKTAMPIPLSTAGERVGSSAIRELLAITQTPEVISLAGGLPAPATFPAEAVAEACLSVLAHDAPASLQYSTTEGDPLLRAWVAERHGCDAATVTITHGSQQALDLLVRATVDPGAPVVVADPAYVGALQVLRLAQADIHGVPSDGDGLCVDRLADRIHAGLRPVLVYVVPDFDNPTGSVLPAERRAALAALADRYGFLVVEDQPYTELRFSGDLVPPVSRWTDRVVSLGTVSKILSPGLRVGWSVAPPPLADAIGRLKQAADLQTATFNQRVVHHVLTRPGFLDRHLAELRDFYRRQARHLVEALAGLGSSLSFRRPLGGMFLWATLTDPRLDADTLLRVAVGEGVAFVPGSAFAVNGSGRSSLRLSFATASPTEQAIAVRRLQRALVSRTGAGGQPTP